MKRNRWGFTLMEMLIVVAIISVLVAVTIPTIANSLEKTKTATCAANRRGAKADLSVKYMLGELEPEEFNSQLADCTCPKNGVISAKFNKETEQVEVYCSIHEPGGYSWNKVLDRVQETREYLLGSKNDWQGNSNDCIREELNKRQDGKWDEIHFEGQSTPFYVKPYFDQKTRQYYLYANDNQEFINGGDWYAQYIYDAQKQQWYTAEQSLKPAQDVKKMDKLGLVNQSWDMIQASLKNKDWKPVEANTIIPWDQQK